jgi:hypothetical protein
MPLFEFKVLDSILPGVVESTLYYKASHIRGKIPSVGAAALKEASGNTVDVDDDPVWPVFGSLIDPRLSANLHPLTIIMVMNPVYHGVDFGARPSRLHAAFRRGLWALMCESAQEEYIVLGDRCADGVVGMHAFTVRVVVGGIAAGSDVLVDGTIVGEYGGDTGVSRLELPA